MRVGSNAVVVKDVAAQTTVVGIPAKPVKDSKDDCQSFEAYAQGTEIADPVMQLLEQLNARICKLEAENEALKNREP